MTSLKQLKNQISSSITQILRKEEQDERKNRNEEQDEWKISIIKNGGIAKTPFVHSPDEAKLDEQEKNKGYKLHVDVAKEDRVSFLNEAIPLLLNKGVPFKVWEPKLLEEENGTTQQGKLLTIYNLSRGDALEVIKLLNTILQNYRVGKLPPSEIQLSEYISYRYANFYDDPLKNPWNQTEVIDGDQSRNGDERAWEWVRKLDEEPKIVSREDIADGRAKIGDIVAYLTEKGYVAAELLDYHINEHKLVLQIISGSQKDEITIADLGSISRTPREKLTHLF